MTVEDVTRITVLVSGPNIPSPLVTHLVNSGPVWGGVIKGIPAGPDRLFEVSAYNSSDELIYIGQATYAIAAGGSIVAHIVLHEVTSGPTTGNAPPIIHSVTLSANQIGWGKTTFGSVSASDTDGSIASYLWSAGAGSIATPTLNNTTYTAPAINGLQSLSITVTDNQGADNTYNFYVDVQQHYEGGAAVVNLEFGPGVPQIEATIADPAQVTPANLSIELSVSVDGDPADFSYAWSKQAGTGCAGSFGDADGDSFNGNEQNAIFDAGSGAVADSGVCTFMATVTHKFSLIQSSQSLTIGRGPDPGGLSAIVGVSLNKTKSILGVGALEQLTATVIPADTPDPTVIWESSDPSVLTVDANGLLTAVAPGNATISATATAGGFAAQLAATVKLSEFMGTWRTYAAGEQVIIPVDVNLAYDYHIDWGDGTVEYNQHGHAEHHYAVPGDYLVTIWGTFPRFFYSGGIAFSQPDQFRQINHWGTTRWASMASAFEGCIELQILATDAPDLSLVTDMSYMFAETSVHTTDLNHWDVSHVLNMHSLFRDARDFNGDISQWDVSRVTDMSYMFFTLYVPGAFNQPIGNWDVSAVTDMSFMFHYASNFNADIGSWDVGQVTDMESMFSNAFDFNQTLSTWDVSRVTNMDNMLYDARSFTNQDLSSWDVSSVTSYLAFLDQSGPGNTEPNWP